MALNQGFTYSETIGGRAAGRTVLDWLTERYAHSSREAWNARIAGGEVSVGGRPASVGQILRGGDRLEWRRPPWDEPDVPLWYEVIHEDESVAVVSKPSGLPTMPAGGFLEHTLLSLVRQRWPTAAPVHRLGRGTSGLVLFALDEAARVALPAAFREGRIRKVYRALASGSPAWDERTIDVPIGPVGHELLGSIHAASARGRPALSHARVIERRGDETVLEVEIATGRPHQIRIHLAAVGHPLVGDPLYGVGGVAREDALPGDLGYTLHAAELSFVHPRSGAEMRFAAWR